MPPFTVRALGEIAIRCSNLDEMWAFYRDIVGLEVLRTPGESGIGFFRIAPGYSGHTTVLALFDDSVAVGGRPEASEEGGAPVAGRRSSLHHLALSVDAADQPSIISWCTEKGLEPRVEHFGWVGWRGVFVRDPEGNTVEFVAADPSFRDP